MPAALRHYRQGEAGQHAPPVEENGARAALALVAPLLGSSQPQVLAQRVEQGGARIEWKPVLAAVDLQRHIGRFLGVRTLLTRRGSICNQGVSGHGRRGGGRGDRHDKVPAAGSKACRPARRSLSVGHASLQSEESRFAIKPNLEARLAALFVWTGNGEAGPGFLKKIALDKPHRPRLGDQLAAATATVFAGERRGAAAQTPWNRPASHSLPGITPAGAKNAETDKNTS